MAKILVLDDEAITVDMLSIFIKMIGHEVVGLTTIPELWSIVASEGVDAFLLDVMLPDGNGLQVCRQLREHPLVSLKPIIMISAHFPPMTHEAEAVGATAYLSKPIRMEKLKEVLGNVGIPVGSPYRNALT
jgi:CheY-like chemotaxis protein